jgi:ribosomal protein S12 methylthiotransferase accessory factor
VSFVRTVVDWVESSPIVDGVIFGPVEASVCAVAVARGFRGFGKGATKSETLVSAVGEALEQYAAAQVPRPSLIRSTSRELGSEAFDPRWLCLYTDAQYERPGFPYRRFDPDRPLHWIPGRWLDSNQSVWLPAFAVFLSNEFDDENLCQATSNGLAAGASGLDAAYRATAELYERDAFLMSWIALEAGTPTALYDLEACDMEVAARLRSSGAALEAYLLREQSPCVAACLGLGDGQQWPALTLGLGAGTDCRSAIRKSVLELGQTGPYFARIWKNREVELPASRRQIRTFEDHALYYCNPDRTPEFAEWLDNLRGGAGCTRMDTAGALSSSVRIAIADVTPTELQESPFRIVRALACGLQPIYYGDGFERAHTQRLKDLLNGRKPNLAPPPIC